jgi:nitroreductase
MLARAPEPPGLRRRRRCPLSRIMLALLPRLHRLAIMANAGYLAAVREMGEVQTTARALGLEVVRMEIRRAEDIAPAFEAVKGRSDALYVVGDPLVGANNVRINALALAARLPTMSNVGEYARRGWSDVLWTEHPGPISAHRRNSRQDSARDEAGRYPGRATDQVRSCHQSQDRQGAWS